jgi:hypothetical protein
VGFLYLYLIVPNFAISQYWQGARMESGGKDRSRDNSPFSKVFYGDDLSSKGYLEKLFFLS